MYYIYGMKNIILFIFTVICLSVYSQPTTQFVMSSQYTMNDTSNVYVKTLIEHFDIEINQCEFMTNTDSMYNAMFNDNFQYVGYYYLVNDKITPFLETQFNPNLPKYGKTYVYIAYVSYVNENDKHKDHVRVFLIE